MAVQIEMWEHITEALVQAVPAALLSGSDTPGKQGGPLQGEELVNYEGMLVSAAAAQRRQ